MAKAKTNDVSATVETFKGFDKNLQCRDFQFAIGDTFEHEGQVVACSAGFHAVEMPLDALTYYPPCTSRYAETVSAGKIDKDGQDSKIASAQITIKAELSLGELTRRAVAWVAKKAKEQGNGQHSSGYRGHASAAGDYGHASAAGDYGHASVKGQNAIACALGFEGTAKAEAGGAIMLAYYENCGETLVHVFASKVGENGIEPGKTYRLGPDGKPVEVTV